MSEANPNKRRKTTRRQIGIDDPQWDRLAVLHGDRGRSDVIRKLVDWYLREPAAKLPERPARQD
ncbi:hypothetical protein ACWKSP_26300 [Micromonosporaceae bacterium Da 78-11]